MFSVASVCVSVCLSVTFFESIDLDGSFLICRHIFGICLFIKVTGHRIKVKVTGAKKRVGVSCLLMLCLRVKAILFQILNEI